MNTPAEAATAPDSSVTPPLPSSWSPLIILVQARWKGGNSLGRLRKLVPRLHAGFNFLYRRFYR
jgi:hypothetical protein